MRKRDMDQDRDHPGAVSRRSFLQAGALAGGATLAGWTSADASDANAVSQESAGNLGGDRDIAGASISQLQSRMAAGHLSAAELVDIYLRRIPAIDKGLDLRSDHPAESRCATHRCAARPRAPAQRATRSAARHSDSAERQHRHRRSPADDCGLARTGRRARASGCDGHEAAARCGRRDHRQSESQRVGELPRLPELERLERRAGASAAIRTFSIAIRAAPAPGPERQWPPRSLLRRSLRKPTARSCVPAGQCGVAGIKPTVGLTSRAGVVPISHTQDTVGAHGRSLADAAAVLGALTGPDSRDPQTAASAGHFFTQLSSVHQSGRSARRAHRHRAPVHRRDARDRCDLRGGAGGHARRRRGARRSWRFRRSTSSTPTSRRSSC